MLVRNWSDTLKSSAWCYRSSVLWCDHPGRHHVLSPSFLSDCMYLEVDIISHVRNVPGKNDFSELPSSLFS